ncbi:MAG: hypothetical protein K6A14_03580 [Erysipelotrichaceae bacterium]|nr:hypothetical protein [Erysipelotrichaceae bacterium]
MNVSRLLEEVSFAAAGSNPLLQKDIIMDELCDHLISQLNHPEIVGRIAGLLDYQMAEKLYEKLINEYHMPQFNYYLGEIYLFARNGIYDFPKAFACLQKAAECNGSEEGIHLESLDKVQHLARLRLAEMYHRGLYVEKNEEMYRKIIRVVYQETRDGCWNTGRPEALLEMLLMDDDSNDDEEMMNMLADLIHDSATGMKCEPSEHYASLFVWASRLVDAYCDNRKLDISYYDLWQLLRTESDIWFFYHGVQHVLNMHWHENRQIYSLDDQMFETLTDLLVYGQLEHKCFGSILPDIEDLDIGYVEDYDPFTDEQITEFHGENRDTYLLEAAIYLMKEYNTTYLQARKLLEERSEEVARAYESGKSARKCVESLNS